MGALTQEQQDFFWTNGYLVLEDAVSAEQLQGLRQDFDGWVEESRSHQEAYGTTLDGRPRFDLESGHTAAKPALRRVNAPVEVSESYFNVMESSRMTQAVTDLIGPNVKLHHTKINSKLPGATTEVKWHQDFPFTPHSNDDVVTALLMVDEVTDTNGPLEVMPGTHTGEIHSIWRDGKFTGFIDDDVAADCQRHSVFCKGPAGSVCLMHTRLLHGSTPNLSDSPRTLFISVYSSEDAVPLTPNPVPNEFEGHLVSGERTNRVRAKAFDIEMPELPKTASFFDQQTDASKE